MVEPIAYPAVGSAPWGSIYCMSAPHHVVQPILYSTISWTQNGSIHSVPLCQLCTINSLCILLLAPHSFQIVYWLTRFQVPFIRFMLMLVYLLHSGPWSDPAQLFSCSLGTKSPMLLINGFYALILFCRLYNSWLSIWAYWKGTIYHL